MTLWRPRANLIASGEGDPRLAAAAAAIVNFMVNLSLEPLDRVFGALADPTRRAILARLEEEDGLSVTALARPLTISLPAVLKHLDVLEGAGLIARRKTGRTVNCRLTPAPMEDAMAWLERYRRFWSESLDRLAALVEGGEA
jgi:DNA-binding transcriptional ArsR family regulator